MTQLLNTVRLLNDSTIVYLKKMGLATNRNEIIKQILSDDACFFKMDRGDALVILKDIGIGEEKIDKIYLSLTSKNEFYSLYNEQKIRENDAELKIKYEIYEADNIFKSKELKR